MKNTLIVFFAFLGLVACGSKESAWVMSPPQEYDSHNLTGDPIEYEFAPKVEVLFVIDNSASMKHHIQKVSDNISQFIDAFSYKNPLSFRLAVTSVYDTITFDSAKYKEAFSASEKTYSAGQLRPVKSSESDVIADKYFISSEDNNYKELLKHTLKVDVLELADGGPQYEESFSPVASVFNLGLKKDKKALKSQKDFLFKNDSYKVIFFVTDASDASNISASELYTQLRASAGGDRTKVMAFGAIVPSESTSCKRDPGDKAYKLEEFLSLARISSEGSNVVSLCEDFGRQFAAFGKSIRNRTLAKVIKLAQGIPVINGNPEETLRVFYGNVEIPFENAAGIVGYTYDPRTRSVHLNPDLELIPQPKARLRVVYTEADPRHITY